MNNFFIEELHIKNFRSFAELNVDFNKKLNVIVGINGAGKSTLLDAISISLSTLFNKINSSNSLPISKDDARKVSYDLGSRADIQSQYPVVVSATGVIDGHYQNWTRQLNGEKSKTTIKDAKEIINYGEYLQSEIKFGNNELIIPMIAYYGTSRLYTKKAEWGKSFDRFPSRLDGFIDALNPVTNEKRMVQWFEEMRYIELDEGKSLPELSAVKNAMIECLKLAFPNYRNIQVNYSVKRHEIIISYYKSSRDGDDEKVVLPLRLMSDGIKVTVGMVADIAHRMARLNPQLFDKICDTPGVILIDEIDMHLHPMWQKIILKSLTKIFPNIQFIVTTHSPIVISNTESEFLIVLNDGIVSKVDYSYGKSVKSILLEIMEVGEYRPRNIIEKLNQLHDSVDAGNIESAKDMLNDLKAVLGSHDPEVVSAETAIELEDILRG